MPVPCGGRGALWRELLILLVPSPRPLPCPGPRLPGLGVRTDAACTQMPVQWVRFCRSCSEESRTHRGVSAHRPSRVLVPPDGAPHSGCVGACGFPCSPPPRGQGHPPRDRDTGARPLPALTHAWALPHRLRQTRATVLRPQNPPREEQAASAGWAGGRPAAVVLQRLVGAWPGARVDRGSGAGARKSFLSEQADQFTSLFLRYPNVRVEGGKTARVP